MFKNKNIYQSIMVFIITRLYQAYIYQNIVVNELKIVYSQIISDHNQVNISAIIYSDKVFFYYFFNNYKIYDDFSKNLDNVIKNITYNIIIENV